jgi:hypothetical protein
LPASTTEKQLLIRVWLKILNPLPKRLKKRKLMLDAKCVAPHMLQPLPNRTRP